MSDAAEIWNERASVGAELDAAISRGDWGKVKELGEKYDKLTDDYLDAMKEAKPRNIPILHEGGIVTEETVAVLDEGELVVPLDDPDAVEAAEEILEEAPLVTGGSAGDSAVVVTGEALGTTSDEAVEAVAEAAEAEAEAAEEIAEAAVEVAEAAADVAEVAGEIVEDVAEAVADVATDSVDAVAEVAEESAEENADVAEEAIEAAEETVEEVADTPPRRTHWSQRPIFGRR